MADGNGKSTKGASKGGSKASKAAKPKTGLRAHGWIQEDTTRAPSTKAPTSKGTKATPDPISKGTKAAPQAISKAPQRSAAKSVKVPPPYKDMFEYCKSPCKVVVGSDAYGSMPGFVACVCPPGYTLPESMTIAPYRPEGEKAIKDDELAKKIAEKPDKEKIEDTKSPEDKKKLSEISRNFPGT